MRDFQNTFHEVRFTLYFEGSVSLHACLISQIPSGSVSTSLRREQM